MIYHGDLFDILPTLPEASIDACVTDSPYGIGFMGKEWDTFKPGVAQTRVIENAQIASANPNLKGRLRAPASSPSQVEYDRTLTGQRGFQEWCEQWGREVLRVLKPGGYLLACGAPRSFHRMTCGLEDAGFEIRDCLSWLFGSGFPKSLDVSKAIDRELGQPRAVAGVGETVDRTALDYGGATGKAKNGLKADWTDSDPNTDEAKLWLGWGTALKPGWEPIIVARKPLIGTVAANVLQYGTGGLNVDACRIAGEKPDTTRGAGGQHGRFGELGAQGRILDDGLGRWPANVVLDDEAAALLDEQSGDLGVSAGVGAYASPGNIFGSGKGLVGSKQSNGELIGFGDSGGASRFFYVAKPSREERDFGTEHLVARQRDESRKAGNPGGDNPRNRGLQPRGNHHPTVKPIELMRWLIRLVVRPGGTVLDCFLGSGTTGIAAKYEQVEFIGIEKELEYKLLADARIAAAVPLFGNDVLAAADDPPLPSLFDEDGSKERV